jgi:multiple sugar transport system ATP-binding protein
MSNLDAQLRDQLRPELRALLHRAGHPVIHVTHDQQEAMGLADRIAVLNGGLLQQVGTPQDLYHRPVNLFVARFLGRPGINLIPGEAGVQLGIRPEHLRLVSSGGLQARVQRREWQGAQQLLWLESSRGELLVLAESGLAISDEVEVSWRDQDALRFSSASGERLD